MQFQTFLTRLDEEILQNIISKQAIKTLSILDPSLSRLSVLRDKLLNIYSPHELLIDKQLRNQLFDLLKPNEAFDLSNYLALGGSGNIYEVLKRANFKNEVQLNSLFQFFELEPMYFTSEAFTSHSNVPSHYPLFSHQRRAILKLNKYLYQANKRVLLHMPTGSGKTRTAMNVIANHLRVNEPSVVIWLAHNEELCEQAYEEFVKAWMFLGNRDINTIRYWSTASFDIEQTNDAFIVAGLSKTYNLLKGGSNVISKLASKTSLVIMDEAHMAIAPTYKLVIEVLLAFNASFLGLSATPGRTWNDPEKDLELSDFFNRQKVTLEVEGYDNPVRYLEDSKYLAKVNNSSLLYDSGVKLSKADIAYLEEYLQLPQDYLLKLSEDQQRNIKIISKIEQLITRHKRIIVFAITVQHSNLLATILQAKGISAFSVTSNTHSSQRKKIIDYYKSDHPEPLIICNYGILTTGFDAPKTSCAVIARPTDSLVLYSQMVGRAIRGTKAGGNEEAEIITVVDTYLPGFDQVANAFFNWEDVWN